MTKTNVWPNSKSLTIELRGLFIMPFKWESTCIPSFRKHLIVLILHIVHMYKNVLFKRCSCFWDTVLPIIRSDFVNAVRNLRDVTYTVSIATQIQIVWFHNHIAPKGLSKCFILSKAAIISYLTRYSIANIFEVITHMYWKVMCVY